MLFSGTEEMNDELISLIKTNFISIPRKYSFENELKQHAIKWIKEQRIQIRIEIESKKSTIGGGFLGFESYFRFG